MFNLNCRLRTTYLSVDEADIYLFLFNSILIYLQQLASCFSNCAIFALVIFKSLLSRLLFLPLQKMASYRQQVALTVLCINLIQLKKKAKGADTSLSQYSQISTNIIALGQYIWIIYISLCL